MAKIFENGKWKKRTLTALSLALATTFSLGMFSACASPSDDEDDSENKTAPTDTQIIKNGNFEFYSDKLVDPDDNNKPLGKYNIISTPDSWSFTSGSPSSDTKSGVIDTADWDYFTKTGGYQFKKFTKGEGDDAKEVETFETIAEAYAHWEDENVSAYDRLKFLDLFEDEIDDLSSSSDEAKLFKKYSYSIDFEDVEKFIDEEDGVKLGTSGNLFELHEGATDGEGNEDNTSVLMIHNRRTTDDGIRGTAQYYTSGTTITLAAGTAAEVSVWVRTDALYHYKDTELTCRGGAYIGVTNTVGGSTLDQMQIYNISTEGQWQKYNLYVRASAFATSTFKIVLGLGQGSSDDKYYAVDGYAFFDDVQCKIISATDYDKALRTDNGEGELREDVLKCTVDSLKKDKQFDSDKYPFETYKTFALDLYAPIDDAATVDELLEGAVTDLTAQTSGSNTYTSEKIDPSLGKIGDNFADLTTLGDIKNSANNYLKNVYTNDFDNKFPFGGDESKVIMLMSANGAAYTTKLSMPDSVDPETDASLFKLERNSRILVSFFVKTSEIGSGLSGASASVVDGENKTTISAFDTTTLAGVDIDAKSDDEDLKDIYKGWAQCFFFIENDTETAKVFSIELSYGPTTIVGTNKFGYGEGYAAFTNFEIKKLTKTEYGYASTGDRAKKVSLTGETEETKKFDSVSSTAEEDLKEGPALPAKFRGVLGGSNFVQNGGTAQGTPEHVYTGLLSSEYAQNYFGKESAWKTALGTAAGDAQNADEWWTNLFGSYRQPLVIINGEEAAYGYYLASTETVSASSYRRISMSVKASEGAKVNLYLIDTTAETTGTMLKPDVPVYTFWYDDDGNIVNSDPEGKDFDTEGEILFRLQPNGLYKNEKEDDGKLYANLYNYDSDDEGNLVTKDGTIAYFYDAAQRQFFAYRDEDRKTGEYTYRTPVTNLPAEHLRYNFTTLPDAQLELTGTGEWTTVSFYLHTGNEAKTYRLEVWSGTRGGETKNAEGSYVFFDNYSSADATADFAQARDDSVQAIKDKLNEGKTPDAEGYLGKDDTLPEEYARYYTFTFFDSKDYLRYDETTDEEELGDPYYSYTQSSNEEQIVYLLFNKDADEEGIAVSSLFLDYAATDVTVEREYPDTDDTDNTPSEETEENPENIWLVIASGSLAVVLVFAIGAVIVRRLLKNRSKRTKIKAKKDNRIRPAKNGGEPQAE